MKKIYLMLLCSVLAFNGFSATWYSFGTGNADDLNSWWSNPGGTGSNPTDFTTPGDIFNMETNLTSNSGTWTLGQQTVLNLNSVYFTVNLYTINVGDLNVNGTTYWDGESFTVINIYGNFSVTGAAYFDNPPSWTYFHLANTSSSTTSPQTLLINTASNGYYTALIVDAGVSAALAGNSDWSQGNEVDIYGTLNLGNYTLNASNDFYFLNGGTLITQNAGGLNGSLSGSYLFFDNATNYIYNGTSAQVTGTYLPGTISSGGSVTVNNSNGVSLSANLTMDPGSSFNMTSGKVNLNGNMLTLNGTVSGHSPVNSFVGSGTSGLSINTTPDLGWLYMDQSIDGSTNALGDYSQNQSTGVTLAGKLLVNNSMTLNSGMLFLNDHQLTLNGTFSGSPSAALSGSPLSAVTIGGTGNLGTLYFDQSIPGTTNALSSLTMNSTGSATLGNDIMVGGGDLNLNAGTLSDGGNMITLTGNITGNGTHTSVGSGEINMIAALARISGATLGNVELNNAAGFSLTGAPTINGTLILTAGDLPLGPNSITFGTDAAIGGTPSASSMLVQNGAGVAMKLMNANGSFTYPIGDALLNYTPATVNFTAGTYGPGANVTVKVFNAKQPNNVNTTNYINRYWRITTSAITGAAYSADVTYVPGDVVGTEANIAMGQYPGSLPWKRFGATNVVTHTLSSGTVSDPLSYFSGISNIGPFVTTTPSSTAICYGNSTTLSVATSSGDPALTYSWAPTTGLSVTTGASVLASPTSTTTYTVTITDGNGLTSTSTSTVNVNLLPNQYNVIGGGSYCAGGTGVDVLLDGSDANVRYQLFNGATAMGSALPGISDSLHFGLQTAGGAYTAVATDTLTGCTQTMSGSTTVVVNPLPTLYAVTGGGGYCAGDTGVHVGLSNSGTGIRYQLYNGATAVGSLMDGTGAALDFGLKTDTGVYTITAIDTMTLCSQTMSGSVHVTVNPLPAILTVIGGGPYCAGTGGVHINLSSSVTGINYQLFSGGLPVRGPVAGTGTTLDFGLYTTSGTYTAVATDATTGCTSNMAGGAVISVIPAPNTYTISGGGSYCAGGTGVNVGLGNSDFGVRYQLYNGASAVGTPLNGIDTAISFGLQTASGGYSVIATDTTTGCNSTMTGVANVVITATVTPSVSLATSPGTTVCQGTNVTYSATPSNGGSTPRYTWMVNGAAVSSTGTSYSFTPVNHDVVSVKLTSNATCAIPDTAMNSITMIVDSNRLPVVSVTANPGNSICDGTLVRFNSAIQYGGTTPRLQWLKNGTVVATTPSYSYIPVNGDVISATLNSNFTCRLVSNVFSNSIVMAVDAPVVPAVTIIEKQGPVIGVNRTDTLVASVTNGGTTPLYQWSVNGGIVPGATSNTFIRNNFLDKDSVSIRVTRQDACGLSSFNSVIIYVRNLGIGSAGANTNIAVLPNPNKGEFTVKGSVAGTADEEVTLEVINMLGQVVYTNKTTAHNRSINEHVQLGNNMASGMYLLNIRSGNENSVFHIVLEK
jgi:hypothetical protein